MTAALGITCHNPESAAFANSRGDAHAPIHGPLQYALETDWLSPVSTNANVSALETARPDLRRLIPRN